MTHTKTGRTPFLSGDDQSQLPVLFLGTGELPFHLLTLLTFLAGRVGLGAALASLHSTTDLVPQGHDAKAPLDLHTGLHDERADRLHHAHRGFDRSPEGF